ncbi:MAG: hypothetical protein HY975_03980 [Candidatus Kerfeldbacteria bacterium]|nr:hypothetical protein [Candidatus Kerfeldbacteria bacterium]
MRPRFYFWRSFFTVLGRMLATVTWGAILSLVITTLVRLGWPDLPRVVLATILLLSLAVAGTRFVPVLGPHLTGLSASVAVIAAAWYGQLWWYVHSSNYPSNLLLTIALVIAAPYFGYLLYRRYVWAVKSQVYNMRPTFDRVA